MTDRSSWVLSGLLAPGLSLLLGACQNAAVSPELDRSSVRVFGSGHVMDVEVVGGDDSGPFPSIEASYATMVAQEGTRSTEVELGVRHLDLDSSDFDGVANGFLVAGRWTFRLDRRLQPVGILGGTWTRFNFTDRSSDSDFSGPGIFAGGGWQYCLSPQWTLGLEGRVHLNHWDGHRNTNWTTSADLGLSLAFRF